MRFTPFFSESAAFSCVRRCFPSFWRNFVKGLDNIYIYMIDCTKYWRFAQYPYIFVCQEELAMRIILDTEKKTITVPWNYTDKLK